MLTPRFHLTQDNYSVTFVIRAPYCNLQELEVNVTENVFLFFSSPYHLRLFLPGSLVGDESPEKSAFDADSGEFTFTYQKKTPNEHFPDLDIIIRLMCPPKDTADCDAEFFAPPNTACNERICEIGFAMLPRSDFRFSEDIHSNVFDVNPFMDLDSRKRNRLKYEQGRFNAKHYASDFIDNCEIKELIQIPSPWRNLSNEYCKFTAYELDYLKEVKGAQYVLDKNQENYCFFGLIDILFAYCYDRRSTKFDGSSESGWNIVKLAATLSWLDGFQTMKETLVTAYRRSLIYPLYRNFSFSAQIHKDVIDLVECGENIILKCLIDISRIMQTGNDCPRYIINNLFIKDYITYIAFWNIGKWREHLKELKTIITREDMGFNLKQLEQDALWGRLKMFSQVMDLRITAPHTNMYESDDSESTGSTFSTSTDESESSDES